jgi:hypothetical protein
MDSDYYYSVRINESPSMQHGANIQTNTGSGQTALHRFVDVLRNEKQDVITMLAQQQ